MKVTIYGNEMDFETLVELMDNEIREKIHNEIAPCTEQVFIERYMKEHKKKYGEKFKY